MQDHARSSGRTRELAIFMVGDILCGMDTIHVQEINKNTEITVVHRAPEYVRGVINLRGEIVTVIDLRKKFGFEPLPINDEMQVVVVRQGTENIGLLVDSVADVITADPENIESPPSNIAGITGTYFEGIYKQETDLVAVLAIKELLKKQQDEH